ncbi:helix-turn-helix domain-containing protein [Micromonospora sp. LZ34]
MPEPEDGDADQAAAADRTDHAVPADRSEAATRAEPGEAAAIVTAARQLAEAEGWPAVSPRRLAERAGVDVAAFYRHFTDRDAVLAAVAVRGFAELAAALTAAQAAAGDTRRA